MSQNQKLTNLIELVDSVEAKLKAIRGVLNELTGENVQLKTSDLFEKASSLSTQSNQDNNTIVEGVFDGEKMLDQAGKEYTVPANYASKSKLIPGDVLKLTITPNGDFLYKQIGPIPRKKIIGSLTYEDGQYKVIAEGHAYKVLLASVTYYKGEIGNKVTLIIPEFEKSEWGAIENILPNEE